MHALIVLPFFLIVTSAIPQPTGSERDTTHAPPNSEQFDSTSGYGSLYQYTNTRRKNLEKHTNIPSTPSTTAKYNVYQTVKQARDIRKERENNANTLLDSLAEKVCSIARLKEPQTINTDNHVNKVLCFALNGC